MPREKVLSSPIYWFDKAQNELFRQFHQYMDREKINQTQLADRLGISKGRVSQILRGESNFSMKTLIELSLSIGIIPKINYVPIVDEIKADEFKRLNKHSFHTFNYPGLENRTDIVEFSLYKSVNNSPLNHTISHGDGYAIQSNIPIKDSSIYHPYESFFKLEKLENYGK